MSERASYQIVRETYNFPPLVDAMVLGADTAESYTIPTGVTHVFISPTVGVWARYNNTAAVPSTEVADGSAPVYIPVGGRAFNVHPGKTISFIRTAGSATTITISRYE